MLLVLILGGGVYLGYYAVQRKLVTLELASDLEASSLYRQSTNNSSLPVSLKKQLLQISNQEDEQLKALAQNSQTLQEYQEQKELLLERQVLANKLDNLLEQAKMRK